MRWLIILALAAGLAYLGATVKLGKRTFFGHVRAIWHTQEAQDLKQGVEDTAGPAVHRLEHGVKVGYDAIKEARQDAGADEGSGAAHEAPAPAPRPTPGGAGAEARP